MFACDRCGSKYNERHIGVEHCPRCRLRDGVEAPLAFKAFDLGGLTKAPPRVAAEAPAAGEIAEAEAA